MTGGPLHFPTSMRRYRRHASITVTGSPILDAAVDVYTTIKKSLGAAEDRVTRRLSGSPERDS